MTTVVAYPKSRRNERLAAKANEFPHINFKMDPTKVGRDVIITHMLYNNYFKNSDGTRRLYQLAADYMTNVIYDHKSDSRSDSAIEQMSSLKFTDILTVVNQFAEDNQCNERISIYTDHIFNTVLFTFYYNQVTVKSATTLKIETLNFILYASCKIHGDLEGYESALNAFKAVRANCVVIRKTRENKCFYIDRTAAEFRKLGVTLCERLDKLQQSINRIFQNFEKAALKWRLLRKVGTPKSIDDVCKSTGFNDPRI